MMRSDFRLLLTTANGLGISPVPVSDGVTTDQLSFFHRSQSITSDRTQISMISRPSRSIAGSKSQPASPVTPRQEQHSHQPGKPSQEDQSTLQLILEELVSMRSELNTNSQNFESLKGEVTLMKNGKKSPMSAQLMRDDPITSPVKLEDQRIPMSSPARPPASPKSKVESMFKSLSAAG